MGLHEKSAEHHDLIYKEIMDCEEETDNLEYTFENLFKKLKSILDTCCVARSHSLILARRGYDAAGIGISGISSHNEKVRFELCASST